MVEVGGTVSVVEVWPKAIGVELKPGEPVELCEGLVIRKIELGEWDFGIGDDWEVFDRRNRLRRGMLAVENLKRGR